MYDESAWAGFGAAARARPGVWLTVLALDLGNACYVSGTKGVGWSGEEYQQDHAPEEGRHLEGGHDCWLYTLLITWLVLCRRACCLPAHSHGWWIAGKEEVNIPK